MKDGENPDGNCSHMKAARPSAPVDMPAGSVRLGGEIAWFVMSLHVTADNLNPAEVTEILGVQPSRQQTGGAPISPREGAPAARFGRWSLRMEAAETDEWDVNEAIKELLAQLPSEMDKWKKLAACGSIQLSLGLSMTCENQEFVLAPALLRFLGEREISVWFDIYGPDTDEASA
jgi:Domain of unknown function (DUF4279)